jgi:hypothetical protein
LLVFGERQEKFVCVKLDLTTGEVTNVLTEMGRTDASTNPQISPDGKYLYYKRFIDFDKLGYEGMRIHRLDLVTGADKEAYRPPAGEMVRLFAISTDGSRIAVGGRGPKGDWVGTAVVGGAETEIVYQYPEKMIQRAFNGIAWAADGKAVFHTFLTGEQRGDTLGLQSLDGSPPRKLLDAGILFNIAAHPNGRELILDSRTYGWELWVMEGIR